MSGGPSAGAAEAAPAGASFATEAEARAELERLRGEIEALDRELLRLIGRRVEAARRVGEAKQRCAMPVLDPAREAAVVRRAGEMAREADLPDEDVRYLFWHLIGLCRRAQMGGA